MPLARRRAPKASPAHASSLRDNARTPPRHARQTNDNATESDNAAIWWHPMAADGARLRPPTRSAAQRKTRTPARRTRPPNGASRRVRRLANPPRALASASPRIRAPHYRHRRARGEQQNRLAALRGAFEPHFERIGLARFGRRDAWAQQMGGRGFHGASLPSIFR